MGGRQRQESHSRHREQLEVLFRWNFLDVSGWARAAVGKVGLGCAVEDLDHQGKALRLQPTQQHFPKHVPQNTPCLDVPH